VCEQKDVTVGWKQVVHTDGEISTNEPDVMIKNKKAENMQTNKCGYILRRKCRVKGSGK